MSKKNGIGDYRVKPYSANRKNIELIAHEGWRKHSIHALLELDVTKGRIAIKDLFEKTGEKLSFTAWIVKCCADAISENKIFNSYRHGRGKIIEFDDIDIAVPVERETKGESRPRVCIIKRANEKTVQDITRKIRKAQEEKIDENTNVLAQRLTRFERFVLKAPFFLKKFFLWFSRKNAFFKKKHMGAVAVTAVGMKGTFPGFLVPLGGSTSTLFTVGGVNKKTSVVNNEECVRDILSLTVSVDHDIIDGSPLARLSSRLTDFIENAYMLDFKK